MPPSEFDSTAKPEEEATVTVTLNDDTAPLNLDDFANEDKLDEEYLNPIFEHLYRSLPATRPGRTLYLSRHGESLYNLDNRIGGNPALSPRGLQYSKALGEYVNALRVPGLKVWTSELLRTQQTAGNIDAPRLAFAELNEIKSGLYDDLTYHEFEQLHPTEFKDREVNKLTYRYPDGESYIDVCSRLEPLLGQMDDEEDLLVISHQAVIRCIFAFLLGSPGCEVPYIKIPLHCLMKVTFSPDGGNAIEYHHMAVECVDTYRPATKECNEENERRRSRKESKKLSMSRVTDALSEVAAGCPGLTR